jgi:hypothetical protein
MVNASRPIFVQAIPFNGMLPYSATAWMCHRGSAAETFAIAATI